jgi:hypothetical protein
MLPLPPLSLDRVLKTPGLLLQLIAPRCSSAQSCQGNIFFQRIAAFLPCQPPEHAHLLNLSHQSVKPMLSGSASMLTTLSCHRSLQRPHCKPLLGACNLGLADARPGLGYYLLSLGLLLKPAVKIERLALLSKQIAGGTTSTPKRLNVLGRT